jgi:hypothetical protein
MGSELCDLTAAVKQAEVRWDLLRNRPETASRRVTLEHQRQRARRVRFMWSPATGRDERVAADLLKPEIRNYFGTIPQRFPRPAQIVAHHSVKGPVHLQREISQLWLPALPAAVQQRMLEATAATATLIHSLGAKGDFGPMRDRGRSLRGKVTAVCLFFGIGKLCSTGTTSPTDSHDQDSLRGREASMF